MSRIQMVSENQTTGKLDVFPPFEYRTIQILDPYDNCSMEQDVTVALGLLACLLNAKYLHGLRYKKLKGTHES